MCWWSQTENVIATYFNINIYIPALKSLKNILKKYFNSFFPGDISHFVFFFENNFQDLPVQEPFDVECYRISDKSNGNMCVR